MAAQKPIRDLFISSEEEEEQSQVSQNVSQRLYEDDEDQMFSIGSSVSNKRSIENVSDEYPLFEDLETLSEDENNRNTISTSEFPMTPLQEGEPKN